MYLDKVLSRILPNSISKFILILWINSSFAQKINDKTEMMDYSVDSFS